MHRARIRQFDSAGLEQVSEPGLGTVLLYLDAHGGFSETEHTTIEGAFVLRAVERSTRIEAWGARTLGGPDELLGCRLVDLATAFPTFVDVPPLERDAPSACGTAP